MKTTFKTYALIGACAAWMVLAGCGAEKEKIDLPGEKAAATENESSEVSAKEGPAKAEQADDEAQQQQPAKQAAARASSASSGRRLSGSFEPQRTSSVAANVGGIIREVYVEEGDVVEEGDRLLNIDTQDYQLRVEQARAAVKAAQAQVDTLETEYKRTKRLLDQKAVARAQADQLSGNLAVARAQLEQAKVGLRMARKARADAVIEAPYTGVVTKVHVAEGNFAAPGPSPLIQLEQVQQLFLRVHVPEQYASQVDEGDELLVQVPALGKKMTLTVDRINPIVAQHSRSFDVLAEVENPNLEVRPGMFAEVLLGEQASGGGPNPQASGTDGGEQ